MNRRKAVHKSFWGIMIYINYKIRLDSTINYVQKVPLSLYTNRHCKFYCIQHKNIMAMYFVNIIDKYMRKRNANSPKKKKKKKQKEAERSSNYSNKTSQYKLHGPYAPNAN